MDPVTSGGSRDPAAPTPGELHAALDQVWAQFRGLMFERLAAAEAAADAAAAGRLTDEIRRRGERECHKLVGALGTFGEHGGSRLAREIEQRLQGSTPLTDAESRLLAAQVLALRRLLEVPGAGAPGPTEPPREIWPGGQDEIA